MKLKTIKSHEPEGMKAEGPGFMFPPSFHVSSNQMPEIKKWEVGKKYKLLVEVEQKSKNETEENVSAGFDITAYAVQNSSHKENGSNPGKHKRY